MKKQSHKYENKGGESMWQRGREWERKTPRQTEGRVRLVHSGCGYSCATQVCPNSASLWQLDRTSGVRRPPTHTSVTAHAKACIPIPCLKYCSPELHMHACLCVRVCLWIYNRGSVCDTLQCHQQWETSKDSEHAKGAQGDRAGRDARSGLQRRLKGHHTDHFKWETNCLACTHPLHLSLLVLGFVNAQTR